MKRIRRFLAISAVWMLALSIGTASAGAKTIEVEASYYPVTEDGAYTSMQEVSVYLTAFGHLPKNFITKKQAQALGWDSRAGNLDAVAPGKSIGGDYFGNYEGNVPDAKGREWTECDIDSDGGYRNGLRVVFSNDGLIYYSDDHYATFRQVKVTGSVTTGTPTHETNAATSNRAQTVTENGTYLSRDEVAAYLNAYGHLPDNFLTRDQAKALGWSSKKNNLGDVAPGCAIGGDSFGNREGLLPDAKGREWFECDVNTENGKRSNERLVWSIDGLIYYTPDNHISFEQLY